MLTRVGSALLCSEVIGWYSLKDRENPPPRRFLLIISVPSVDEYSTSAGHGIPDAVYGTVPLPSSCSHVFDPRGGSGVLLGGSDSPLEVRLL
nr:hypothetical protein Iba_scaffold40340CG0040 [Ipomoea batatas]